MEEGKRHRKHDRQFKEEAVRLVTEGGRTGLWGSDLPIDISSFSLLSTTLLTSYPFKKKRLQQKYKNLLDAG